MNCLIFRKPTHKSGTSTVQTRPTLTTLLSWGKRWHLMRIQHLERWNRVTTTTRLWNPWRSRVSGRQKDSHVSGKRKVTKYLINPLPVTYNQERNQDLTVKPVMSQWTKQPHRKIDSSGCGLQNQKTIKQWQIQCRKNQNSPKIAVTSRTTTT